MTSFFHHTGSKLHPLLLSLTGGRRYLAHSEPIVRNVRISRARTTVREQFSQFDSGAELYTAVPGRSFGSRSQHDGEEGGN
jgi:hypothetical protein